MRSCPVSRIGAESGKRYTDMTTYREPPNNSGNGPAVSIRTRSSGSTARDVVRYGVGARMPLAIEHPEHGTSSPISWIPCCRAVAFSTLEWAWARGTWKWLISNTLFFCLGTIHQGRALLQPSHYSHSKQTQTLLPFPMLQYNFFRQSRHPRCSSCKNYSYVMFHAQRGSYTTVLHRRRGVCKGWQCGIRARVSSRHYSSST